MTDLVKPADSLSFSKEACGSFVVCLSALSTFSPVKIYPVMFFLTAAILISFRPVLRKMWWVLWMCLYSGYVLLVALCWNVLGSGLNLGVEQVTNLVKLVGGVLFSVAVINWVSWHPAKVLRRQLDIVLHISFFLTLLQLLVYQAHNGFQGLIASSSFEASGMYSPELCFWGVADKNIFGARIALFGFLYIFNFFIWKRRFPIWRSLIVLLCAFLSESRTPLAALFVGICYVLYRRFGLKGRLALGAVLAVLLPLPSLD